MHASNSTAINPRSIVIRRRRSQQPEFINILSHHYEPLHYVLFFPHAEIGWGASHITEVPHMTQHQWYRGCLLADNNDCFSTFGHLCCEYLVDMYSRTEEQKLAYIARECCFREHELHAANESLEDEFEPTIKLPASFVGSHAWTSEQASDAMALGRKYGKPTFFMTMTFNPDWPEVQSRLLPGQTVFDVPIVVAHTFKSCLEKVHQQIPYFVTVPTVITIIVQYLTVLTAYVTTGSQFHGNPALTQPDTARLQYVSHKVTLQNFPKSHRCVTPPPPPLHHHHCNHTHCLFVNDANIDHTTTAQSHFQVHFFFCFVLYTNYYYRPSVCTYAHTL